MSFFFNKFSKTFNNNLNKTLSIYVDNRKLIRNKSRGWEKKLIVEIKEIIYELLIFLETRRGWYLKWYFILFVLSFAYRPMCIILRKNKTELLYPHHVIEQLDGYQKDNFTLNLTDEKNKNKMISSYWINYL